MIDLHMHSTFSTDARDEPEALVDQAAARGLTAMAVTEHNNIDSLDRARRHAAARGIEYIHGIELGGRVDVDGEPMSVDILGYFFNDEPRHILEVCQRIQRNGRLQTDALLAGLALIDIPLTREMVAERYPDRVSSWAIRRMLREAGHAEDKPAVTRLQERAVEAARQHDPTTHQPPEPVTAASLIAAIRADGGLSFMAHPFWLTKPERGGHDESVVWRQIEAVLALGADGLEAYNRGNDAGYGDTVLAFCRERDLPASGGSDSHGARNVGADPIDDALLESMRRHHAGRGAWSGVQV